MKITENKVKKYQITSINFGCACDRHRITTIQHSTMIHQGRYLQLEGGIHILCSALPISFEINLISLRSLNESYILSKLYQNLLLKVFILGMRVRKQLQFSKIIICPYIYILCLHHFNQFHQRASERKRQSTQVYMRV